MLSLHIHGSERKVKGMRPQVTILTHERAWRVVVTDDGIHDYRRTFARDTNLLKRPGLEVTFPVCRHLFTNDPRMDLGHVEQISGADR